jgi:hypothetical protein
MSAAIAVNEVAERTWPAPDFLNAAQRLRAELEAAIRLEQSLTQRVADIQNKAFARGLPTALIAGGAEKLSTLANEQNAASLAVNGKRVALRHFLDSARTAFFAERNRAQEQLRAEIAENFACMQKAATEIRSRLENVLGAAPEAEREERLIHEWNRQVDRFNGQIPTTNTNGITRAARIELGESLRARVEQMILQDAGLRELCRGIIADKAERRERAWAAEEARRAANETKF